MAKYFFPKIQNNEISGILIPEKLFNGTELGFGVFIDRSLTERSNDLDLDVGRAGRSSGAVPAGKIILPAGTLYGFSLIANPDHIFSKLNVPISKIRTVSNTVDSDDLTSVNEKWKQFIDLNADISNSPYISNMAKLNNKIIGKNLVGAIVNEGIFGRSFINKNNIVSDWGYDKNGYRLNAQGRAAYFLQADTLKDWQLLARTCLLHIKAGANNSGLNINRAYFEHLIENASMPNGLQINVEEFRELLEAELTIARSSLIRGRPLAKLFSEKLPPHEATDRTSKRVVLAQYSTPPAIGEIASEFLKPNGKTILEPCIGNGVFVSATYGDGGLVTGIEYDEARADRAKNALPNAKIINGDASKLETYLNSDITSYDAAIINPPFGDLKDNTEAVEIAGLGSFKASKLETYISAIALNKIKDGGNAVLVMPANMFNKTDIDGSRLRFQTLLCSMFDKVNSIVLESNLYKTMGASVPVIVHFCENKFSSKDLRPGGEALILAEQELPLATSFDAFFNWANTLLNESNIKPLTPEEAAEAKSQFITVKPAVSSGGTSSVDRSNENKPAVSSGGTSSVERSNENKPAVASGRTSSDQTTVIKRVKQNNDGKIIQKTLDLPDMEPNNTADQSTETILEEIDKISKNLWFQDDLSPDAFTTQYIPLSKKGISNASIERALQHETRYALEKMAEELEKKGFDSIDHYVAEQMGMTYENFMKEALFFPEQVDSIALAFWRCENNKGMIIGDQMGVGKGIQLAALAYSSICVKGNPVLFMSNKANLFTDFCLRDLKNASLQNFQDLLNNGKINPIIINSFASIIDPKTGKKIFTTKKEELDAMKLNMSVPLDKNLTMMTYSQVQIANGVWRLNAIKNWCDRHIEAGRKPLILLDEVHKAAGDKSRTGLVMQNFLYALRPPKVNVIHSSATSLKSGRNLPIYQSALPDTGLTTSELLAAIDQMPLPMQEVLASEMASSGSLIERKMADNGVERDLISLIDLDEDKMKIARNVSDLVASCMGMINEAMPEIKRAAERLARSKLGGNASAASLDKLKIDVTSPATTLDSFSRYLMGSIKGAFIKNLLAESLQKGEKPTVVIEYTGDTISKWYVSQYGDDLENGVVVPRFPNIGDAVIRAAERVLEFKATSFTGETYGLHLHGFDHLIDDIRSIVEDHIDSFEIFRLDIFDQVKEACHELGATFEDITGRSIEFVKDDNTGVIKAYTREIPDSTLAVARYNNGTTDVLGLNNGSSTGVSAQANPSNGFDLRRRSMIKLGFQKEITNERQIEGRIHRAGQINYPRYITPVTGFAADDRIANLFNRANRSLTSSTSGTRENKTNATHIVDILNPVGEIVVTEILREDPNLAAKLDIDMSLEGKARKLLGRSILLPLEQQSEIMKEVDIRFSLVSNYLTTIGQNPLKIGKYDWNAEVIQVDVIQDGSDQAIETAKKPLYLNEVKYKQSIKLLDPIDVIEKLKQRFSNMGPNSKGDISDYLDINNAVSYGEIGSWNRYKFSHPVFDVICGRKMDGGSYIFPREIPENVITDLVSDMEIAHKSIDIDKPINKDDILEKIAQKIKKNSNPYFSRWADALIEDDENLEKWFDNNPLDKLTKRIYPRIEAINRFHNIMSKMRVGNFVLIHKNALSVDDLGIWTNIYDGLDDAYIPAVVTGARFEAKSPMVESANFVSLYIIGSQKIANCSLSALVTSFQSHNKHTRKMIFSAKYFLNAFSDNRWTTPWIACLKEHLDKHNTSHKENIAALNHGSFKENSPIIDENGVLDENYKVLIDSIFASMPTNYITTTKHTLEGNLFAAMSFVSLSDVQTKWAEKILYTDKDNNSRNAILLSGRRGIDIPRIIKKRSLFRSSNVELNSIEDISSFIRFYATIFNQVDEFTTKQSENFANDICLLFKLSDDDLMNRYIKENSNNVLKRILSDLSQDRDLEGFQPSLMTGGDIWRSQSDQIIARALNPEAFKNKAILFSECTLTWHNDRPQLNAASNHCFNNINKDQTALLFHVNSGFKDVSILMNKKNKLFEYTDMEQNDLLGRSLMSTFRQEFNHDKLPSGILASRFNMENSDNVLWAANILNEASKDSYGEFLISGMMNQLHKIIENVMFKIDYDVRINLTRKIEPNFVEYKP